MPNRIVRILTGILAFTVVLPMAQAQDVPQSFTLDGQLFSDAAATIPLIDGTIALTVQILDEDKICILYEETQNIGTLASKGYFTAQIGTAVGSTKRTLGDPGHTMSTVFQNITAVNGRLVSDGQPCSVPAGAGKRRYVRMTIAPQTMGAVARTLSPDLTIDSVPNSIVAERAETLQGLRSTDVLKVNTAAGSALSQNNLESLFSSSSRFDSLTSVIDGTSSSYMRSNSNSGAQLPVLPGAPTTPPIGAIWFDSSDSKIKFQTSVGPTTIGTSTGSVTSVGFTAPSELSVTGAPVTSSGTIAVTWASQMTNKVFAAPDGSTGTPSFRVLTANDIPSLAWTKITSALPTTLLGYGITDAVKNAGGTPSLQSGLNGDKGTGGTAGRIWISTDTKEIFRDNGTSWDQIGSASAAPSGAAGGDLANNYPNPTVAKIQGVAVSATAPATGQVLRYNSTAWAPANFSIGDLKTSVAGTPQFASATCTAAQTLTWSSLTDTFTCKDIAGLSAATITSGTIDAARLPASTNPWTAVTGGIGYSAGNVGIGTTNPNASLHIENSTAGNTFLKLNSPTTYNGDYRQISVGSNGSEAGYWSTGQFYLGGNGGGKLTNFTVRGVSTSSAVIHGKAFPGNNYGVIGENNGSASTGAGVVGTAVANAGVVAESRGTTNDTLVVSSRTLTTGRLSYFEHLNSNYSGDALHMNLGQGSGSFSGNFLNLQNNGSTKLLMRSNGSMAVTAVSTSEGLAVSQSGTGHAATFMGGNVGIGTATPTANLDIQSPTDAAVQISGGWNSNLKLVGPNRQVIYLAAGNGTYPWQMVAQTDGSLTYKPTNNVNDATPSTLTLKGSNVGIGNTAPSKLLHVGSATTTSGLAVADFQNASGTCTITPASSGSGIACSSDERLKENFADVTGSFALDRISRLQAVTYNFKTAPDDNRRTGYKAQEVQKIAPEFVRENDDGYLQVYYDAFIPWITEAIKTLHSRLTGIESRQAGQDREIASLKAKNAELKARLDKLEKALESK